MTYENGSSVTTIVRHPITMRATPTLTATNSSGAFMIRRTDASDSFDTITLRYANVQAAELHQNSGISGTGGDTGMFRTTSAASYIHMAAEL